jgi:glycosyltransferase involved in cell wall biosynthesis
MRVLILHQAWGYGGAERTTEILASALQSAHNEVIVAGPHCLPEFVDLRDVVFLDVTGRIPHGWFPATDSLVRKDIAAASQLLDEVKPDVAIGMMHYSAVVLSLGARQSLLAPPVIAGFRGPISHYIWRYEQGFRRRLSIYRYLIAGTRASTCIAVPFQGTGVDTRRHFFARKAQIRVIPNGLNGDVLRKAAMEKTSELVRFSDGIPVICVAARLSKEKDISLLIRAVASLPKSLDWRVALVGDGPESGPLQDLALRLGVKDKVVFIGYQRNVYPFLQRADIYVHTCVFEGFGYAMLESMLLGTPVIATDCPTGPRELLGPNRAGILVRPGSVNSLANALHRLLAKPDERHAMALRALARAKSFSTEAMVGGFKRLIDEVSGA